MIIIVKNINPLFDAQSSVDPRYAPPSQRMDHAHASLVGGGQASSTSTASDDWSSRTHSQAAASVHRRALGLGAFRRDLKRRRGIRLKHDEDGTETRI